MLLLFCRIIIPDEMVLALHRHQHTTHKPISKNITAKLEQKHIHCPTDHLFNSLFYFTQTPFRAQIVSSVTIYQAVITSVWKFTFPNNQAYRGPPVA
ncbi:hypothetical protein HUW51_06705 [Adhaeribacter swui]|uniref:Uncharacterized protein n=1 Tax=Adhaeribacter swui TaxID=2086471 RepID=A0A7G7G5J9_9BACT|nr:hypothetical protein [Adhaeribacter swui]QNF32433.1 hypothetical protein HUW51_06705 [Adhaeribacter swui]